MNTTAGLNRIDLNNFSFETYFGDFAGQLVFDAQESVLWIAGERLKKFNLRNRKLKYYDTGPVHSILLDSRGWIWLGTESGVKVLEKETDRLSALASILEREGYHNLPEADWTGETVNNIYEDLRGNIWLGVREKLIILDHKEKEIEILAHEPDNDNSPTGATISGIYGNKSGVIWITYLNQGVSKVNINLKKFKVYRSVPGDPNSLGGNAVRSVFQDRKKFLWVGTYDHGLDRVNLRREQYMHFRHNPSDPASLVDDYITSLLVDDRQRLWVGSFNRGICYADHIYSPGNLRFSRAELLSDMEIHEITQDPAGRIWISTQDGLFVFDGKGFRQYGELPGEAGELREMNIQSVVFDPPDIFWLATWNSGLCRLVLSSDSVLGQGRGKDVLEKYDRMEDQYSILIDNKFITIHRDDAGNLWLGSFLNGLIRVVENEGGLEFIRYDKSAGAPDNSIYGLISDGGGRIWLSTNHGLGRFDPETEQFRNYNLSDGLQSNSFMWDACFRSPDGQLFFGGIDGLNAFYPEDIEDNLELPEVFISKLIINNEDVDIGDELHGKVILSKDIRYTDAITLSHREPVFSLEFTAMDNINPWEVMYRYRLEGFDDEWIQTDAAKRNVRYTNLNPGTYTFQVKASNSDGIWNEVPATLVITVKPPWWQTWWAILSYSFIFALLL